MANDSLTVNIVTPDGIVYDHKATMVVVEALDGQIGIMANHEPLIAPLQIGVVRVTRVDPEGKTDQIAVNGGFMEVNHNVASIVADSAERERNIDVSRAENARVRAQQRIEEGRQKHDTDEVQRASIALQRALNRLNTTKP